MTGVIFFAFLLGMSFIPQILTISWAFAAWRNYYSLVDVVWSLSLLLLAAVYAAYFPGEIFRKFILVTMVGAWSLRLTAYLVLRLRAKYPKEDTRYEALKKQWDKNSERNFFVFYLLQGIAALILAIPFWTYLMHPSPQILWNEILGILLFIVALTGETVADEQMRKFKSQPANAGKIFDKGLWQFSRHPNYFCEWLIWLSFALMAVSAPRGGLALLAPAFMLAALLKWTGIPANESHMHSPEAYELYRKRTNAFFPWKPRPI